MVSIAAHTKAGRFLHRASAPRALHVRTLQAPTYRHRPVQNHRVLYPTDGSPPVGYRCGVDSARAAPKPPTPSGVLAFLRHSPPSRVRITIGDDTAWPMLCASRLKYRQSHRWGGPRRPYMIVRWPRYHANNRRRTKNGLILRSAFYQRTVVFFDRPRPLIPEPHSGANVWACVLFRHFKARILHGLYAMTIPY